MGGAPSHVTKNFRGANVDPTTYDALVELARVVGDDIYLDAIDGYGSYSTNPNSGGTDTGGGHCDINAVSLNDEQARRVETRARSLGFVAYLRPPVSPYTGRSYGWQRHVHLIRRDCVDLSDKARWQVGEYDAGRDGLAVPHKDTGSRAYVGMTWAKYLAAQKAQEAAMPTPAELWSVPFASPTDGKNYAASTWLVNANVKAGEARAIASQALAQVAALTAAFKALAAQPDLSVDQVTAAAKAGAQAALDEKITGAVTNLTVGP